MKRKLILNIFLIVSVIFVISCSEDNPKGNSINPVDVNIAVFSDPHYFDPELGMPGQAFFDAKINSRKMIAESEEILKSTIKLILSNPSDLVIIPGDLTKDGEKSSHIKFAEFLRELTRAGKKVIVVPGNHDVANPEAYGYSGEDKYKTETVTPLEFSQIYSDFGYGDAIYKDNNSLSYISEPINGLWIVALDACRYRENTDRHVVGGRFQPQTLDWVKEKLREGKSKGKLMLGVLHHGILEHFSGQKVNPVSSEFVVDDYLEISKEFSEHGLNFIFTGHFHANDIVKAEYDKSFIYDIETGSILTYPVPMRFINIEKSEIMNISTAYIENVAVNTNGRTFQNYAKDYITNDLDIFVSEILTSQFNLKEEVAKEISPVGINAFMSHYRGDEIISKEATDLISKYGQSNDITVRLFMAVIQSLYTDLNPQDNNIRINMRTGKVL